MAKADELMKEQTQYSQIEIFNEKLVSCQTSFLWKPRSYTIGLRYYNCFGYLSARYEDSLKNIHVALIALATAPAS